MLEFGNMMDKYNLTEYEERFFGIIEEEPFPFLLRFGITEGVAKSYPIDSVIRFLSEGANIPPRFIRKPTIKRIAIDIPRQVHTQKRLDNITRVTTLCGWFCDQDKYWTAKDGRQFHTLYFSPTYPASKDVFNPNGQYLYHISPKKYMHKILKQGFCPSHKSKKFNYPSRNYFFIDKREINHWKDVFNRNKNTNEEYVCYTIDTRPLEKYIQSGDVVFYLDEKLKGGIFTTSNIPPSLITNVEDMQ